MKKLNLSIDDLKVESFETQTESKDFKGTVKGYESLDNTNCNTCPLTECITCRYTCGQGFTCVATEECFCPTLP